MSETATISPDQLVATVRGELEDAERAIRSHRFLDLLNRREVPRERLREFAGEQHSIVSSDRRSFAQLAARFPAPPAGDFFLGMAQGEGEALGRLLGLAAWLGLADEELRAHDPRPGAQAYPAFVAWLALNGSRSDVVLAFLANPPADFERRALAVLAAGLGEGESPERARRATRLLQAYELSFWDAMVE